MIVTILLIVATPMKPAISDFGQPPISQEQNYTKKKKKRKASSSSGGGAKRFRSCKEALRAGYSHMRRGQPGYSANLDRDGDGVACDKMK
jgi:Excalibur calcium-binding domain